VNVWGGTGTVEPLDVDINLNGDIVVTGYFYDTADFDPTNNTYNIAAVGSPDAFLTKFDTSGVWYWAVGWGSTGQVKGDGVALDSAGNIFVTGGFHDECDFDPGPGTYNITPVGGYHVCTIRWLVLDCIMGKHRW